MLFNRRKKVEQKSRRPGESLTVRTRLQGKLALAKTKLVSWLSTAFLIVLVVVPIILFIWLFFGTNVFNVQAVTVVDAREDIVKAAKEIINKQIEGGPLGKNIFFVQTDALEEAIEAQLAQVRTVHVVRKLPATIKAIIQEKEPALLLLSGGKYYFVDSEGVAYEEARLDTLPGVVLPTVKNDDENAKVTLGVAAVQASLIEFLMETREQLPEMIGAELVEVHIPSLAAREVRMRLNNNWTILFDVTRSAAAQLQTLRQLLRDTVTPEELKVMQYVDLRIPNRVYYRTGLGDTSL